MPNGQRGQIAHRFSDSAIERCRIGKNPNQICHVKGQEYNYRILERLNRMDRELRVRALEWLTLSAQNRSVRWTQ
jgi:hypothetical protein